MGKKILATCRTYQSRLVVPKKARFIDEPDGFGDGILLYFFNQQEKKFLEFKFDRSPGCNQNFHFECLIEALVTSRGRE